MTRNTQVIIQFIQFYIQATHNQIRMKSRFITQCHRTEYQSVRPPFFGSLSGQALTPDCLFFLFLLAATCTVISPRQSILYSTVRVPFTFRSSFRFQSSSANRFTVLTLSSPMRYFFLLLCSLPDRIKRGIMIPFWDPPGICKIRFTLAMDSDGRPYETSFYTKIMIKYNPARYTNRLAH